MKIDSLEVRIYNPDEDKAFVYASWLNSYKYSSYFAKRIHPHIFFKGHQKVIDHLLAKPLIQVLVAHPKDDENTMLGYLCYERDQDLKAVVHFVYVKDTFKKMGVARALFDCAEIATNAMKFTHWTLDVNDLMEKYPKMVFDPYAL